MNKKLSIAMGMALAGMSSLAAADAHEGTGLEFGADVAFTTNYVFRGISESGEEPAIQGNLSASHDSGIYANLFGASVDGYTDAPAEMTYTLGWGGDVGPVGLDLGVNRYTYPGETGGSSDTTEFYIGVSKDFGMFSAGLSYAYSDDWYGATPDEENQYWMISGEVPVGDFTISAHYGDTERDGTGEDYSDWSLGVSTELGGFGFALTYTDTNDLNDNDGDVDEDYVAFSISKSL